MADGVVESPYERREALIIVNPAAHNVPSPRRLQEADEWLQEQGWRVHAAYTQRQGDAKRFAARAAEDGIPLVIVCGGDGTVSEVANGLAHTETALGTIPGGTSNIWAREIGLDKKPLEAVQLMAQGQRRRIDLGRTGDHYFILLCGFGIDAAVTQNVSLAVKQKVGAAAYVISAAREALRYRPRRVTVRMDGIERSLDILMAFAGNTRLYAGITRITPTAVLDDGLLDVCIYQGRGRRDIALHAVRTILQLHRRASNVLYRRVRKLEFDWEEPLPVQLDGDPLDYTPHEVVAEPSCLWVAMPPEPKTPLFTSEDGALADELTLTQ